MLEIFRKSAGKLIQRIWHTSETSTPEWTRPIRRWGVFVGCCALLSPAGYTYLTWHPGRLATSAIAMRDTAVREAGNALSDFVWDGGMLTDELESPLNGMSSMPSDARLGRFFTNNKWNRVSKKDQRILPDSGYPIDTLAQGPVDASGQVLGEEFARQRSQSYVDLQSSRAIYSASIEQLAGSRSAAAGTAGVKVLQGELYALEGYAEIMLADLFCSGVPLNTFHTPPTLLKAPVTDVYGSKFIDGQEWLRLVFDSLVARHAIAYHPSSTTAQVYHDAIAKFDTAIHLAGDSARILNLARVGKGRAWLALGRYDSAAAAVARVPKGFVYLHRFAYNLDEDGEELEATVADRKGNNGLPFISSGDPRTATEWIQTDKVIPRVRMPVKYWHGGEYVLNQWTPTNCYAPLPLASWEEAVLIQAEAALHRNSADPTWLRLLNELRATAPIPGTTQPNPAKLLPLKDPGTDHGRIALLFAEREYWLFLTGHRQGDLRRLVREYHWPQDQVYPIGPYIVPKDFVQVIGRYGTDVNIPIPSEEKVNPLFHGCLDRGA
jgi:hypothetical protein